MRPDKFRRGQMRPDDFFGHVLAAVICFHFRAHFAAVVVIRIFASVPLVHCSLGPQHAFVVAAFLVPRFAAMAVATGAAWLACRRPAVVAIAIAIVILNAFWRCAMSSHHLAHVKRYGHSGSRGSSGKLILLRLFDGICGQRSL